MNSAGIARNSAGIARMAKQTRIDRRRHAERASNIRTGEGAWRKSN